MKVLILTSLLFSFASFAETKEQVGENANSEYAQCMLQTIDCTTGCEKKCEHLNPSQFRMDMEQRKLNSGKEKSVIKG